MAEEYSFKPKKCYCGLDLAGKTAEVVGLYRGVHPMGKCPGCGTKLVLDTPPVESVVEAPEPVASSRRSRSSK